MKKITIVIGMICLVALLFTLIACGQAGGNGEPSVGIASIEKTGSNGLVDTYTITLTDGETSTFTVTNGRDGITGDTTLSGSKAATPDDYFRFTLLEDDTYEVSARYIDMPPRTVIPATYKGKVVSTIGNFVGRESIDEVVIPEGVTSIVGTAFSNCRGLRTISIPDSIMSVGDNPFNNCETMTYNEYEGGDYVGNAGNPYLVLISDWRGNGKMHSDLKVIAGSAFYKHNDLESITIPEGVRTIGRNAFGDTSGLFSITLPSTLTSIEENAFSGCGSLLEVYNKSPLEITAGSTDNGYVGYYAKAVYTSDYVSKISTTEDGYTFYKDGSTSILLKYTGSSDALTLPAGLVEIKWGSYGDINSHWTSIHYEGTIAEWCAIQGLSNLMSRATSATKLYIGGSRVEGDAVIPDGVTTIEAYAFYNLSLNSVTIPTSVTNIGDWAFSPVVWYYIYQGTVDQWREIAKGYSASGYTVHCLDGDV